MFVFILYTFCDNKIFIHILHLHLILLMYIYINTMYKQINLFLESLISNIKHLRL